VDKENKTTNKPRQGEQEALDIHWVEGDWWLAEPHGRTSWHKEIDENDYLYFILKGVIMINTLKRRQIESIELELGECIFRSNWRSDTFHSSGSLEAEFNIPFDVQRGKRTTRIKYIVDGITGFSGQFAIDIPHETTQL
jgi:hypothetical protein